MASAMVGFVATGRTAWIFGCALGAVLLIIGLLMSIGFLVVVGIAFLAISGLLLIMSLVTNGASD